MFESLLKQDLKKFVCPHKFVKDKSNKINNTYNARKYTSKNNKKINVLKNPYIKSMQVKITNWL